VPYGDIGQFLSGSTIGGGFGQGEDGNEQDESQSSIDVQL